MIVGILNRKNNWDNWFAHTEHTTTRNSSCGKVMFSQAYVKNSIHRGVYVYPSMPCQVTHAPPWAHTPPAGHTGPLGMHALPPKILRDMVNEQAVRILLECHPCSLLYKEMLLLYTVNWIQIPKLQSHAITCFFPIGCC